MFLNVVKLYIMHHIYHFFLLLKKILLENYFI